MYHEIDENELQQASANEQRRLIRLWFLAHYEDPINELYYDNEDPTGFGWMGLSQHDANDVLTQQFDEIVPDDVIKAVADELTEDCIDWLQKSDLDDFVDDYRIEGVEADPLQALEGRVAEIEELLKERDGEYLRCLALVGVISALEAFFLDYFSLKVLDDEGRLRRYVESAPEFRKRKFALSDLFERREKLKEEVRLHLVKLTWHRIWTVREIYQATFGIEVPKEALKTIGPAVGKRHDIVHRGRQTKKGEAVTVDEEELKCLLRATKELCIELDALIAPPQF